jgi:hypothetical protein
MAFRALEVTSPGGRRRNYWHALPVEPSCVRDSDFLSWQVYNRICSGRAVLSPDTLQQLVRRKAPLQQFEELLECTDGLHHVFYVWTGSCLFSLFA